MKKKQWSPDGSTLAFLSNRGDGKLKQIYLASLVGGKPMQLTASNSGVRGSGGYGEQFRKANVNDWGDSDFEDLMAGVDYCIAKGWADPERLGIMGWSYGGYLTAMTIAKTQGPWRINILEIDLKQAGLEIESARAQDHFLGRETTRSIAARWDDSSRQVIAALNADFFNLNTGEIENNQIIAGEFVKGVKITGSPHDTFDNIHSQFAMSFDGRPLIERFAFAGKIIWRDGSMNDLSGVNTVPDSNALVIFHHYYGTASPRDSLQWGVAEIELAKLTEKLKRLLHFSLFLHKFKEKNSSPGYFMWLRNAGLKRKFLLSTIAAVILITILGSGTVYWLLQINPTNAAIYLAGVTLFYIIAGITAILLITRIMVQPVLSLTEKVAEVRHGNLNVEIITPTGVVSALRDAGDEMNQLITGFAQMVRDLRSNIEALQQAKEKAEEYSEKLEQSNRRLEGIFDGLPDGVMIIDREFRLVHVNPVIEKIMGKSLAQVRGEHCYEMCQGGPRRCSFCRADTVFQLGGRASTSCTKPAFAGAGDRMMEIYDFPLYNEKGEIDQVIEYVKDVTQAVQMQQQLERTQRLAEIGNMAAIVAHEVRNPLNAILGAVHYLQGERLDDGLRTYLKIIEEQVNRVSKVTANLLDFAKPLVLEFQRCTLPPVIEQALKQVERLLKKRRIHVAKDIAIGLPMFPIDPTQVERALVNVLTNAIEAMPVGGHLHIGAQRPVVNNGELAEEIEVTITDDGPGLGNRDPEEFFKPFFTTKLQGTGLGLHIVRKIMDSHQGKVRLESNPNFPLVFSKENRGGGTRAVLTFPTRLKVYETETHHFGYR